MVKGKEKLYITAQEWSEHGGGAKSAKVTAYKRLPFSCCSLSLTPFDHPVMTPDGTVYDLTHIVPFVRKHRINPATGEALTTKELIKLTFHKNAEGQYACPVTGKVFTEHTRIVAVKTSGNVYSWDAIDTLCLQPKRMVDLISDEPFTKDDLIMLQDPGNAEWLAKHDVNSYYYIRNKDALARAAAEGGGGGSGGSGSGGSTIRSSQLAQTVMAAVAAAAPAVAGVKRPRPDDGGAAATAGGVVVGGGHVTDFHTKTTPHYAASFTSTTLVPQTRNVAALETEADRQQKRWKGVAALGKKALVQLVTNLGALNVQLHVDFAPRTCENFLLLARRGYYNGTPFHRLIRNFMIQGGDPTGTGRGGESAWGAPFPDEFHAKARHDGRGVLAMANAGPDTNRSQFYITFKSTPHLDDKHTVFGSVVGGMDVLRQLEVVPTGKDDKPTRALRLESINIFTNPFDEYDAAAAVAPAPKPAEGGKRGGAEGNRPEGEGDTWLCDPALKAAPTLAAALAATGSGGVGHGDGVVHASTPHTVGKYLPAAPAAGSTGVSEGRRAAGGGGASSGVVRPTGGGFGTFDAW